MKSLCCILFIVISTSYIVQSYAEKPAICSEGSVHYCKDMQSAKVCNKLRFCQMVWDPPAGYEIVRNGNHYNVLNPNIGFFHVG